MDPVGPEMIVRNKIIECKNKSIKIGPFLLSKYFDATEVYPIKICLTVPL